MRDLKLTLGTQQMECLLATTVVENNLLKISDIEKIK
jgi:hypothetical protein